MAEVVLEGNTALIVIIVIVVLDLIVVVVELVLNSSYCFDESRPPSGKKTCLLSKKSYVSEYGCK